jgi:hypothetical protein
LALCSQPQIFCGRTQTCQDGADPQTLERWRHPGEFCDAETGARLSLFSRLDKERAATTSELDHAAKGKSIE